MKIIYVKKAITINKLWLNILNVWAYASRQCNKYLFKCSKGKKHCRQGSKVQKKEGTTQNRNDGGPTENDCDSCVHDCRIYVRSYWSFFNISSAWLSIMRNYKFPNGLFCRDARPKSSRVARTSRPVAVWIWTEDTDCFADSRLNGPHSRAELPATWRGKVWSSRVGKDRKAIGREEMVHTRRARSNVTVHTRFTYTCVLAVCIVSYMCPRPPVRSFKPVEEIITQ